MYTLIIRPLITQRILSIDNRILTKIKKLQTIQKKCLRIARKTPIVHSKQTTPQRHWNTIPEYMDQRPISKFLFKIKLNRRSPSFQNRGKNQKPQIKAMSPTGRPLLPELSYRHQ